MNRQSVLIASPSGAGCDQIKAILEGQEDLNLITHVMAENGFADMPISEESEVALLILDLGDKGESVLKDWTARAGAHRMPMIVVGPTNYHSLMRLSMKAGARDYLMHPLDAEELLSSVQQVLESDEQLQESVSGNGRLTAVINAKGGSGASVVACNLAHILTAFMDRKTALIDMDLQFGALPLSFDLQTRDTVLDVIGAIDKLDPIALRGHMTRHQSGLDILGCMSDQLVMPWEVSSEDVGKLLKLGIQTYEHVVVDLPRVIDPMTSIVLGSADRILLVLQQSFTHLRDAKRMFDLMQNYLGVPRDRLTVVINRHTDRNSITVDDVRDAVHPAEVMFMPNDYANVIESMNVGVPLYQMNRQAPITKALCRMAERVDEGRQGVTYSAKTEKQAGWRLPRMLGLGQ